MKYPYFLNFHFFIHFSYNSFKNSSKRRGLGQSPSPRSGACLTKTGVQMTFNQPHNRYGLKKISFIRGVIFYSLPRKAAISKISNLHLLLVKKRVPQNAAILKISNLHLLLVKKRVPQNAAISKISNLHFLLLKKRVPQNAAFSKISNLHLLRLKPKHWSFLRSV